MKNILTLGTIRDYIIKWFPDLLWWDSYHKHEKFDKTRSYKHRQGMPNEIRIEFDSEDYDNNWQNINITSIKLNDIGYSFAIYYVEGGRSPHIHIYDLDELENLSQDQRNLYRRKFLLQVCPNNSNPDMELCDEKHLCALEFANHFKYNKPKQLLYYFWNGMNSGIDLNIKLDILFSEKKVKVKEDQNNNKKLNLVNVNTAQNIMQILSFEKVFDNYNIEYRGKMALCPFHNDSDKSLSFSNEKKVWKCFGCQEKGDLITLVKKLEGISRK